MSEVIEGNGGITMIEFNNWYKNIEQKYPLYQDKDGYNIGNIRALRVGWKAALEWVLKEREVWGEGFDDCVFGTIIEELHKEE